jgi:hypothetical protein
MQGHTPPLDNDVVSEEGNTMGKRLFQAATITCMLYGVVAIGSAPAPQRSPQSDVQVLTNDSTRTLFPTLKGVFQ